MSHHVFSLFVACQVLINFDAGVMPSLLNVLVEEYPRLTSSQLGVLGSLPYLGLIVGGPPSSRLLQKPQQQKNLLLYSLSACVVSSCVLGVSLPPHGLVALYIGRLAVGIAQGPFVVYASVWVDEFAPHAKSTRWLGWIQAAPVVGIMTGYLSAGFMVTLGLDWRVAVWGQAVLLSICSVLLYLAPADLVNLKKPAKPLEYTGSCAGSYTGSCAGSCAGSRVVGKLGSQPPVAAVPQQPVQLLVVEEIQRHETVLLPSEATTAASVETESGDASADASRSSGSNEVSGLDVPGSDVSGPSMGPSAGPSTGPITEPCPELDASVRTHSLEYEPHPGPHSGTHPGTHSGGVSNVILRSQVFAPSPCPSFLSVRLRSQAVQEESGWKEMRLILNATKILAKNSIFRSVVVGLSALYFVVTGIQYWMTRYFQEFMVTPRYIVIAAFAATASTAPTLGVISGGHFVDKLIPGGYRSPRGTFLTLLCCTASATISCTVGVCFCFCEIRSFPVSISLIWLLLFFGGAILPPGTGILLSNVQDPELRTFASGISMMLYNILGYALGSFLPGVGIQRWGFRKGIRCIFSGSFVGVGSVALATAHAHRKWTRSCRAVTLLPIQELPSQTTRPHFSPSRASRASAPPDPTPWISSLDQVPGPGPCQNLPAPISVPVHPSVAS